MKQSIHLFTKLTAVEYILRKKLGNFGIASSKCVSLIKKRIYKYEKSTGSYVLPVGNLRLCIPERYVSYYLFEPYEPLTLESFRSRLRKGMVVIDVGAHIGFYSLVAASLVGETGRVFSIEPFAENRACLQRSVKINKLTNIEICPFAAGSVSQMRTFYVTPSSDSNGFFPHVNINPIDEIQVQEFPLDAVIKGKVDVVKIDVEGAEIEVLQGMSQILAENPRLLLWIEWNHRMLKRAGHEPSKLLRLLKEFGFNKLTLYDEINGTTRQGDIHKFVQELSSVAIDMRFFNLLAERV